MVALAYPLFGTTATHFLALRQYWGDATWQAWCRALVANKPFLVDGNSVAARQTGGGEVLMGFTDSDDAASEQHEGLPVGIVPLGEESLILHNTAGVLRDAPHPGPAQQLFEYLQSAEVQQFLVQKKALESAVPDDPQSTSRPESELGRPESGFGFRHEGNGSNFCDEQGFPARQLNELETAVK